MHRALPATRLRNLAALCATWSVALVAVGAVLVVRPGMGDAFSYWRTWHEAPYASVPYPPPALLLFAPAIVLPSSAFVVLWIGVLVAAGAWLLWPLPIRLRIPIFIALTSTFTFGNVATLLAVPLALAPRWPVAWSIIGWTKITPAVGAIALVRQRRWADIASLAAVSVLVGLIALVLAPDLVAAWVAAMHKSTWVGDLFLPGLIPFSVPVAVRLPIAVAIAWFGASRPWTLAIAAAFSTPDLSIATCGLLAAIPRLQQPSSGGSTGAA